MVHGSFRRDLIHYMQMLYTFIIRQDVHPHAREMPKQFAEVCPVPCLIDALRSTRPPAWNEVLCLRP